MTDTRSRREKLEAMARATESPHEAAIARRLLDEMGSPDPAIRQTAYRTADDLLSRMDWSPDGHTVRMTVDGWDDTPGALSAMVREMMARRNRPRLG
jgi:hypothetical protein